MNKEKFSNIITSTTLLSKDSLKELQDVIDNFPYCQSARTLLAKGQHDNDSMLAHNSIKKASLYSIDRRHLKKFIEAKPSPTAISLQKEPEPVKAKNSPEKPVAEKAPEIKEEKKEKEEFVQDSPSLINTTAEPEDEFLSEVERNLKELQEAKEKANKLLEKPIEIVKEQKPVLSEDKSLATEEKKTKPSPKEELQTKPKEAKKIKVESPQKASKETSKPVPEKKSTKKATEFPKLNLQDQKLGYDIFSSRYGEMLHDKNDLTGEYTREFHPDLFLEKRGAIKAKKKALSAQIIDNFIASEPSITPIKEKKKDIDSSVDLSAPSTVLKNNLVSENLANIYKKQGNTKKAIAIYEGLMLKYPEKKTYFADQISKLK